MRVPVIDDDPDARAMVGRLLEDRGAVVTATDSADEVIRLVGTAQFDVLFIDMARRGEDGYSLIRRVRAVGRARRGGISAVAR